MERISPLTPVTFHDEQKLGGGKTQMAVDMKGVDGKSYEIEFRHVRRAGNGWQDCARLTAKRRRSSAGSVGFGDLLL